MRYLTNKKGVTLTELMVTVAIIGVLTMIAVPSFIAYLPHLRLKAAIRDVVSDLRLARAKAVSTNRNYYICFNVANNSYSISENSDCSNPEKTVSFPEREYWNVEFGFVAGTLGGPEDATLSSLGVESNNVASNEVTFSNDKASFAPIGTSNGGVVYVRNEKGETFGIVVEATIGRAKIWRWNGAGWVSG